MTDAFYYKVFTATKRGGNYYLHSWNLHAFRQRYYFDKVNKPKYCNPIFAFDTTEKACLFALNSSTDHNIIIAQVKGEVSQWVPLITNVFFFHGVVIPAKKLNTHAKFREWLVHESYLCSPTFELPDPPIGTIGLAWLQFVSVISVRLTSDLGWRPPRPGEFDTSIK